MTPNPGGFTNIGAVNQTRPYVNGNREQVNNYTLDGLDVNETIDNRVAYQASPDALAEISVETNNYSADTGNVGGALISSVIKSGANQFRGNVFEFYRNSSMDANSWENNRSNAPKAERKQHIFGGTLGGPIIKDKLFFFADYQGSWRDAPGSALRVGRAGHLARGRPLEPPARDRHPGPADGAAVPEQPDPGQPVQPDARSRSSATRRTTRSRTATSAASRTTTWARRSRPTARTRATCASTGTPPRTTSSGAGSRSPSTRTRRRRTRSRSSSARATTSPSGTSALNWSHVFGPSVINEVLVGYSNTNVTGCTFDWAGIGDANATYGIAGGQIVRRAELDRDSASGLTAPGSLGTDSDT